MFRARHPFTVTIFRNLACACRHPVVQRCVIPERADGVEPRVDLALTRQRRGLERHPLGNREHSSAAASTEIAADDVRERSAIADERQESS